MYFDLIRIVLVCCCLINVLIPVKGGNIDSKEDTLVRLEGKVLDKISNKPLKATIYYEKLPYGNDLGVIQTKDSGNYEIDLFPSSDYKILVRAKDYLAIVENIFPTNDQHQGAVQKNYYLRPLKLGEPITLEHLIFGQGDFIIQEHCYNELNQLIHVLNENEKMEIQLEGHTDFRGNKKLNYKLSIQRVNMIKEYLVEQGINKDRIKTKAFGGESPLNRENSEASREMNRRVEIRILKL